jgi:hypothetical protein
MNTGFYIVIRNKSALVAHHLCINGKKLNLTAAHGAYFNGKRWRADIVRSGAPVNHCYQSCKIASFSLSV